MPMLEKAALRLILLENSFQFNEHNYLQTHGTAVATKLPEPTSNQQKHSSTRSSQRATHRE